MGRSTLRSEGKRDRIVDQGHTTGDLGPSDSSDTGSDVRGGPGLGPDGGFALPLDTGTTSDPDTNSSRDTAGADIGDRDLDSDSDAGGTGERQAAGRDPKWRANHDRLPDNVESLDEADLGIEDEDEERVDDERGEPSATKRARRSNGKKSP